MTERLFTAALTFVLLIGGTLAIGAEWLGAEGVRPQARHEAVQVVLPRVEVIGCRTAQTVADGQGADGTTATRVQ